MYISPAKAQYLSDLPPTMSRALVRTQALIVLATDQHPAGIHHQTIQALHRHGLIQQTRDGRQRLVWRPTPRGTDLIAREEPRLLALRSQRGYTTRYREAILDEPEAIDEATCNRFAQDADHARRSTQHAEWVRERRELEQQLARLAQQVDHRAVHKHLRVIRDRLNAIDKELRAA